MPLSLPAFTPLQSDMRLAGHIVSWFDAADSFMDAPEHNAATYTATAHRFPDGLPPQCTLHYHVDFCGQPVIIDHRAGVAYGLRTDP